MINGWSTMWI